MDLFDKSILVFGCGNILLGDDGFGPAVIECLEKNFVFPPSVLLMDVGTSIRDILFDLILSEQRPQKMIVIDAVDFSGHTPGEVFEISVEAMPASKISDFSLHQFPSVNMLKELKEHAGMDVRVVVVQVDSIPDEVRPGLSAAVAAAVPVACDYLANDIKKSLLH
jgi:coenzyme F420 hydrogenase subunit delta